MRSTKLVFLLLILVLSVSSLFSQAKKNSTQRPKPRMREISGDVSVVTRSGQSIKLDLVEVKAIPEAVIIPFIENKKNEAKKVIRVYTEAIEKGVAEVRSKATTKDAEEKGISDVYLSPENRELGDKARFYSSGEVYFPGLPEGETSAKTDSDGKFTLSLKGNVKYCIAAKASRKVGRDTERYYWLFWLPPEIQGSKRLFLSNDNLTRSNYPGSLIQTEN